MGTCAAFCTGFPNDPACADPDTGCLVAYDGVDRGVCADLRSGGTGLPGDGDVCRDAECFLECLLPELCPEIVCRYDGATSEVGCEIPAQGAAEAVACVLGRLETGEPLQWKVTLENSYPFVLETHAQTFQRLSASIYAIGSAYRYANDIGQTDGGASLRVVAREDEWWTACAALERETDRIECLLVFSATVDSCPDPRALVCPE